MWCPGCHRYGFPTLTKLVDHYRGNDEIAFIAVQTAFEDFAVNNAESAIELIDRLLAGG